jgi:PRC-barrel domain protein
MGPKRSGLAGYVLAAFGAVLAFSIWAVIYYFWRGNPPASIEPPAPTSPIVLPDHAPAVAVIPGDRIPDGLPFAMYVYNVNGDKVGQIAAVLLGNDQRVAIYIVKIGESFLDGADKDIAVPAQKLTWIRGQNYSTKQYEWTAVVTMTRADMENASKQIFDLDAKKWVPAQ